MLRNTETSLNRLGLIIAAFLLPITWLVVVGLRSPDGGLAWALGLLLGLAPYLVHRFSRKFTVRGNVLEVRTLFRRIKIDLPSVDAVALRVSGRYDDQLVLILNGDIKILLGEGTAALLLEPAALLALALALQKSPFAGHCEVGQQLQRLALNPSRDSWPV